MGVGSLFNPERGSSHSPEPGPRGTLSTTDGVGALGSHPEAGLELLWGWSWGATSQPVWKEHLLGVGIVLGATGQAEMCLVLGLIPRKAVSHKVDTMWTPWNPCISTTSLCDLGHFSFPLCASGFSCKIGTMNCNFLRAD